MSAVTANQLTICIVIGVISRRCRSRFFLQFCALDRPLPMWSSPHSIHYNTTLLCFSGHLMLKNNEYIFYSKVGKRFWLNNSSQNTNNPERYFISYQQAHLRGWRIKKFLILEGNPSQARKKWLAGRKHRTDHETPCSNKNHLQTRDSLCRP